MLLIIDNYDSFTYNLVQYFQELGITVDVYRNDELTVEEIEAKNPQQIVISPGPGTPHDAGVSLDTIKHFAGKVPLLGVCLGHQAIAQAFGGAAVRAPLVMHGKASEVVHDGKTIFLGLEQRFSAGRYHSLIVDGSSVPECLESQQPLLTVSSWASSRLKIEGVQFHLESILTFSGKKLLANFLGL